MEDLPNLIKRRGHLKSRVTFFKNFLQRKIDENLFEPASLIEINERTEKLAELFTQFDEVQLKIEDQCEDIQEQLEEREDFENAYYQNLSQAKSVLEQKNDQTSNRSGGSVHSGISSRVSNGQINIKLPTINLPKFGGNLQQFQEFHDTYVSLIHENAELSDIQRFHYLRASLEGEALDALHSIQFSAANYHTAWETLCDRYLNRQLLAHNNIKTILNLPVMQRETFSQLREIQDGLAKQLKSLRSLDLSETELFESFVIYIVTSKLDPKSVREWESINRGKDAKPSLGQFQDFLKEKCSLLEILSYKSDQPFKKSRCLVSNAAVMKCYYCKANHSLYQCDDFKKLSVSNRMAALKKDNRCTNCLRQGHLVQKCNSRGCKKCRGRHHSLLHEDKVNMVEEQGKSEGTPDPSSQMSMCSTSSLNILLATALVKVVNVDGMEMSCRVLLDSGSQSNLISSRMVKRLNLETKAANMSLTGIGQSHQQVSSSCDVFIKATGGHFESSIPCLVVDKVCGVVPLYPLSNVEHLRIPCKLRLADPSFHQSGDVDMLLGAQCFWEILNARKIKLNDQGLVVQKTKLGWIVSGPVAQDMHSTSLCNLSITESPIDVQNQLEKFWTLESYEVAKDVTSEGEEHFKQSTTRTDEGRFMVSVPLKEPYETLGNSYESAKNRFLALERKLNNHPDLQENYRNFMQEYEELGHMVVDDSTEGQGYYMPHHGVINEGSSTTKLRVVFDASMVTTSGKSLNDIQVIGSPVQNELFTILLRFRRHKYALCADIEKMYRQVLVTPRDQMYQKILWRSDATEPVKSYMLRTVTYGTAAAPFLATRALHELGNLCQENHPRESEVIQKDFYVDDMLSGADTIPDAVALAKNVSEILSEGCFPLRKWRSNSTEVIQALVEDEAEESLHKISSKENAKTLGLIWNQKSDEFVFDTSTMRIRESATKRLVLSVISKMFDPLGILSPITIVAKIMLQQIWLDKLSWDETLPEGTLVCWLEFCEGLVAISELRVPRYILNSNYSVLHLHGFSDASEKAYGACVYIISVSPERTTSVLLCGKSRVAPLRPLSVPRLELCAAHLLAQLVERVVKDLNLEFASINLWSDSTIVLSWVATPPRLLKTFVRNRIGDIQELTKSARWRHVSTTENPADLVSRGSNSSDLKDKSLWWKGPPWLVKSEEHWPKQPRNKESMSIPELRKEPIVLVAIQVTLPIDITRFSKLGRMQRTFAFCRRFINNCRNKSKEERMSGPLKRKELEDSLLEIIKFVQRQCFAEDIKYLEKRGIVHRKSAVLTLNPFIEDDLLRVGGRLLWSNFHHSKKHPLLLPKGHHLTKLIMEQEHVRLGHAGPEQMLASVRDCYWPIGGRNTAKEVFRKCVKCFRVNPKIDMPIMGSLPSARLEQSFPFTHTGMDYAGPILVKNKLGRGAKLEKAYVCIFVCLTTRAIHLETVTSLTSEAFLAAFKRFIARRGRPTHVYSDNGTNFIGAKRELNEISEFLARHRGTISDAGTIEGVQFHFIPPRSPHFGGMWEAGVKCTKTHLKRIMANAHLTFEGVYTVLTQIEAILNSRPLSPLSSNPVDMEPLTPAHFLIGRKLTSLPEYNVENIPINRLSMYQRAQQMAQHFWRRWSKEYVAQLQQRQKWKTSSPNIQKDTLVIVKEDNLPPIQWKLGRIVELHPGRDGVVRVVSVKCGDSVSKRPCAKICPLPLE